MLRHAEASAIVEFAYNDKAILEQRNMLTEELYGNTFQLYKVALQSIFLAFLLFLWAVTYLLMPCFQTVFLFWFVLQETILKDPPFFFMYYFVFSIVSKWLYFLFHPGTIFKSPLNWTTVVTSSQVLCVMFQYFVFCSQIDWGRRLLTEVSPPPNQLWQKYIGLPVAAFSCVSSCVWITLLQVVSREEWE